MPIRRLSLLLLCSLFAAACDDNGTGDEPARILELNVSNLAGRTGGAHYEAWVVLDDRETSVGKFNVSGSGTLVPVQGAQVALGRFTADDDLRGATAAFVTLEPEGDTDLRPSGPAILAGDLVDGAGTLSTSHARAVGVDLGAAAGGYVVQTPSDGPDSQELSGLWFVDGPGLTPGAGLRLPPLATAAWTYEAWVEIAGLFVSTGRFRSPAADDGADPYSFEDAVPPFPGEDFLRFAPRGLTFPAGVQGSRVLVTVEPRDDDGEPSPFRLLTGQVPDAPVAGTPYALTAAPASLPRGTARVVAE